MSSLRVLMYHKVHINKRDFLTVDIQQLREQLVFVQKHYHVIRLSELIALLQDGKTLPENALLITFDDGYQNNYELAYPVFRELGIPFCIFLVATFIGKKQLYDGIQQDFLSVEQLVEMQDLAEFGLHGNTHQNLMDIPDNLWDTEVHNCVKTLDQLPVKIQRSWAYTYGSYPRNSKALVEKLNAVFTENGVVCAFRIGNRINHLPIKNPFYIQRLDIRGSLSMLGFRLKLRLGKLF